jgi:hypothetical protein
MMCLETCSKYSYRIVTNRITNKWWSVERRRCSDRAVTVSVRCARLAGNETLRVRCQGQTSSRHSRTVVLTDVVEGLAMCEASAVPTFRCASACLLHRCVSATVAPPGLSTCGHRLPNCWYIKPTKLGTYKLWMYLDCKQFTEWVSVVQCTHLDFPSRDNNKTDSTQSVQENDLMFGAQNLYNSRAAG